MLLKKYGLEAQVAKNGEEVVVLHRFDLLLMNQEMPSMHDSGSVLIICIFEKRQLGIGAVGHGGEEHDSWSNFARTRIPRIARAGVSAAPIDPVPEPGDEIRVMVTASLRSSNSTGGGCGVFYIKQWRLQIVVVAAMSAALVDLLEFNLYTNGSCCYEVNLELGSWRMQT
nr:two-component response regulator ARR22-like [Ipomoea trifida]